MPRIFLSYAREDHEAAKQFALAMEGAGHEVWWDYHLRAGSRFSSEINAALNAAEAVVVLWSKVSIESVWVQDEAAEGLEGSRLVPVTIDGAKPPLGFRQYHTVDLSGWRSGSKALGPLLAAIASMSGAVASATARAPATSSFQPTICVLPFVNRSGDPEQDYFSDGITEDVITDLAKVSALSVVGRNASFALKGETGDHGRLANELGVTHLLEGAVRKSGSRLRITTQLVEASGGRTLWAERFDREFTDVFEIQDEISHAIVAALRLTLLPGEKSELDERGTTNAKAYDAYLKARALWSRGDVGDTRTLDEIVRLSSEATSLDPGYASAWALTALAGAELRFWHGRDVDTLKLAEKALALDPRMAEPHCVRARGFAEQGRETEADAALNTALELDRQSWEANREAAHLLFRRGRVREALPLFEKALSAMRTEHDSATMLMACCAAIGNSVGLRNAALAAVGRAEHLIISDPANGSAFASGAYGFAVLGEEERARKWMRKALAVDPGNLSMRYTVAAAMVSCLNEQDQAVEVLEPFIESIRFPAHLALIERDPRWAAMRDKDAFQSLLGRARKRVAAVAPAALTA